MAEVVEPVCPVWAADMACLTGRGSSPEEEIVTLGAAEMELRDVAEVDLIRDEDGGCCCWGVLGDAP